MNEIDKSKLIILKNERKIFEIKFKPARDSEMGEVDIILNPPKKMAFENVVVGNEMRVYDESRQVTSISWHGYFKKESREILYPPIIHIKSKDQIIDAINSFASINSLDPVPIPVCSLYIPRTFNLNGKGKVDQQECNYYLDIGHINEDVRCDIFVFPKNISHEQFKSVPSYPMFIMADLEIYNNPDVGFNILKNYEECLFKNIYGHDILVRVVIDPADIEIIADTKLQIYKKYSNSYTLILNDAHDAYNKTFGRLFVTFKKDGEVQGGMLKDMYEKEIGIEENNDKFWDSFRQNF